MRATVTFPDRDIAGFDDGAFKLSMANSLNVGYTQVAVNTIRPGSVIIDMEVLPSPTNSTSSQAANMNTDFGYDPATNTYSGYLDTNAVEYFLLKPDASLSLPASSRTPGVVTETFTSSAVVTYTTSGDLVAPDPASFVPPPPPPPPPSLEAIALQLQYQQQLQHQHNLWWWAVAQRSKKKGLSGAIIALIVVSSVIGLVLVSSLFYYLMNNAGETTLYSERGGGGIGGGMNNIGRATPASMYYYEDPYNTMGYMDSAYSQKNDNGLFGQTPASAYGGGLGETQMVSPSAKFRSSVRALTAANAMSSGGGASAFGSTPAPMTTPQPTIASRWQTAAGLTSPSGAGGGGGGTTLERYRHALEAGAGASTTTHNLEPPTPLGAVGGGSPRAPVVGRPMLIPEPWVATSDSYGRTLYYNNETGETRPTPPPAAIAASTLAGLL